MVDAMSGYGLLDIFAAATIRRRFACLRALFRRSAEVACLARNSGRRDHIQVALCEHVATVAAASVQREIVSFRRSRNSLLARPKFPARFP
jgi:hypothetical protein